MFAKVNSLASPTRNDHHDRTKRKRQEDDAPDPEPIPKRHRREVDAFAQSSLPARIEKAVVSSPFRKQTSSLYLPLAPISQRYSLEGLCAEHLSPLLLTYYRPFGAVILSYHNPYLSEHPMATTANSTGPVLSKAIDAYGPSYVWLTADFLLFRPKKGQILQGWINLQNESHLGIVCWNLFNASIQRRQLPRKWSWNAVGGRMNPAPDDEDGPTTASVAPTRHDRGEGYFIDGRGMAVEGWIQFRLIDFETAYSYGKGFLTLEGTMLDDDDAED